MTFCSKSGQFATVLFMAFAISSGCSVLPNSSTKELPADIPVAQETGAANYYVEVHSGMGMKKVYLGSITEPTTVQQALLQAGALDKIRSPVVDLYRMLPGGAQPLKLPVEFEGDQVKYEQDYALHPNDRIIVRNNPSSKFDKFVDSLTPGK